MERKYKTKMKVTCKVCGVTKWKKVTPGQSLPQYCSRKCMYADSEFHKRRTQASTKTRRTPQSRKKTAEQTRQLMADPVYKKKVVGALRKANKAKQGVDYEVPCACGCGQMVRRNTGRKDKQARFIHGHHTRTPEWKARQSKRVKKEMQNPEKRKERAEIFMKAWDEGKFPQTYTQPVLAVLGLLDALGLNYEVEVRFGHYSFDIWLPNYNAAIEVHGDYWHANPRVYPDGPINDIQSNRLRVDASKAAYLANRNIPLLVIWEYDIKNDIEAVKKAVQDFIHHSSV